MLQITVKKKMCGNDTKFSVSSKGIGNILCHLDAQLQKVFVPLNALQPSVLQYWSFSCGLEFVVIRKKTFLGMEVSSTSSYFCVM